MRWLSQVFRQTPNSPKNMTRMDFSRLGSTIPTASKVHSFHVSVRNYYTNMSVVPGKWTTSLRNRTIAMEENICERYFLDNVSQNSQSRYTVKLLVREQMLNN